MGYAIHRGYIEETQNKNIIMHKLQRQGANTKRKHAQLYPKHKYLKTPNKILHPSQKHKGQALTSPMDVLWAFKS